MILVHALRRSRSVALLGLSLLAPASSSDAQTVLPSPQVLAARHDSLVGGREALEGYRSMRLTGTLAMTHIGLEGPLEILRVRPNRLLTRVQIGPIGELLSGFDGERAWMIQPGMGPMVITGPEQRLAADQADFFADLHDLSRFDGLETVGRSTFEGRPVYEVRMQRPSGDVITEYFDVETGLSAGSRASVTGPLGPMELISIYREYRPFGRLLRPTKTIQKGPQFETLLTITDIEFDLVSEDAVATPAAVRAIIPPR